MSGACRLAARPSITLADLCLRLHHRELVKVEKGCAPPTPRPAGRRGAILHVTHPAARPRNNESALLNLRNCVIFKAADEDRA